MFFLAKVCACGEYVLGLVEAILDVFGSDPGKFLSHFLFLLCILFLTCHTRRKALSICGIFFHSCGYFLSKPSFYHIQLIIFMVFFNCQLSHIANWCEEQH